MIRRLAHLGVAMLATSAGVMHIPASAQQAETPAAAASDGYVLGRNDEIEITIFSLGQTQSFQTRIKEDGTATVPYLGAVKAIDVTARQLSDGIASQLKKQGYFNEPIVGVEVREYVSNAVTVFGQVAKPGVYPLSNDPNVAMVLAQAGGAGGQAADYVILRRSATETEHQIPLSQLTGEWSTATRLQPGDTLFIPNAPTIFIYGQVNSPGAIAGRSDMTVRQALARAGGPTLAGSEKKVTLHRGDKKIKKVGLDDLLQDGDVLYINEKLF